MSELAKMVNGMQALGGDSYLRITCSATGDWTDSRGKSVGTTTTSGIYKMKVADTCVHAINGNGDGAGIIILPDVVEAAGRHYFVIAPTGAAGDDIDLFTAEGHAQLSTNGDMDADGDHILLFSTGIAWLTRLDGVA